MLSFAAQRVYLQLFLVLACGIALGAQYPLPSALLLGELGWILGVFAALGGLWLVWRESTPLLAALPGFAALFAAGYLGVSISIGLPLSAPLRAHVRSEPLVLWGRVADMPRYRNGHLRFMLDVEALHKPEVEEGSYRRTSGLVYAYLRCEAPPELYLGDELRLFANLREASAPTCRGQFNYRAYLLGRGTVLTAYAPTEKCLVRRTEEARPLWAAVGKLRARLTGALARRMPPELGALAVSVVYGDKITDLPEDMEERFRAAGLTHILVASGTQVSLLIVLLALLFWRARYDFTWRSVLVNSVQFIFTLGVVLVYAAVTGFETSIVRALIMGILIMAGRLIWRNADGLTTLSQSALILLLLNPLQLFAPGFQLSFGATFGLIYAAGVGFPLLEGVGGWRRWLGQTLITTGGAQLFVAPILIANFNQLSLWGLISNLIAIPLGFALLIVGGLTSIGLGNIPLLGVFMGWCCTGLAWSLDTTARIFAALPGASLAVPALPWWWLAAFYALLLICGEWIKLRDTAEPALSRRLKLAVPLLALPVVAGVLWWWLVPSNELCALSPGGSEAYLWRPATGRNILILRSAGLTRGHNADTITSALRHRGINRLHAIVWIDEAPRGQPLTGYNASYVQPGEPLPEDWDMQWLSVHGAVYGAQFAVRGRPAVVLWGGPPAGQLPGGQTEMLIVHERTWQTLDKQSQVSLHGSAKSTRIIGKAGATYEGKSQRVTTEMSVYASSEGLRESRFELRGDR